MKPWRSVLKTYLVRWQFWCLLALWGTQLAGYVGAVARGRGPEIVGRLLLFGAGYGAACLGMHVKEQLGSYRARLIPGFRGPHLATGALMLGAMVLAFPLTGGLFGVSFSGGLGLALPMAALFFTFGCRGGRWGLLVAVTCVGVMVPHVSGFLTDIAAGELPAIAAAGIAGGFFELARTFRFLWTMDEETPGYEWRFRSNLRRPQAEAYRRQASAQVRYLEGQKSFWLRLADAVVPDEPVDIGTSKARRVLQWRRAQGNWIPSLFMPAVIWGLMLFLSRGMGNRPDFGWALQSTCWVPLGMPQMLFFGFWYSHYALIGRELTYPVRRRDYFREQGIGILIFQYMAWAVLMIELVIVTALSPESLSPRQLAIYILFTGAWQLPALGATTRLAATGSALGPIIGYVVMTGIGTPILIVLLRFGDSAFIPALGAVAGAALPGVALVANAYRKWLRTETG